MPIQTKQFTIDGDTYEITQLGAKQGRKIWLKLVQVAAAPLKELSTPGTTLSEATLLAALGAAVESLDEQTAEQLYEAFGETCTLQLANGNAPKLTGVIFDQHFAGRYVPMSKWLWECVRFNFASFLDGTSIGSLTDLAKRATAVVGASRPISPQASTGSSGEF